MTKEMAERVMQDVETEMGKALKDGNLEKVSECWGKISDLEEFTFEQYIEG